VGRALLGADLGSKLRLPDSETSWKVVGIEGVRRPPISDDEDRTLLSPT